MNRGAPRHDYTWQSAGEPPIARTSREIYDELLVSRCRRRDLPAWDELVDRWNDRLLYYLRRLIDHEHDATNALQEVWLRAYPRTLAARSAVMANCRWTMAR
jgi:hypothetical protein